MSFVTNILTPIITACFIGGFVIWILFMIYKGISKSNPNFKFTMKYKVFRKKFDEKAVEWCMGAVSKEMSRDDTEKYLLMKGIKPKRTREAMYIYDQVLKTIEKGGKEYEQLRQSNEREDTKQTKLPEIKKG